MELLYFYIQDHKIIPSSGINFGGELIFQYNREYQELILSENPSFVSDFFNDQPEQKVSVAHISNISAIVGENGAGKSTILNLLMETLAMGALGMKVPYIVAVKEQSGVTVYSWSDLISKPVIQTSNLQIDFQVIKPEKVISQLLSSRHVDVIEYPKIPIFDNVDFVFFSNIYDHSVESKVHGIKNISTNYLSGLPDYYEENELKMTRMATSQASDKDEFRYQEIRRQIDLINSFGYEKLIPFDLPDTIVISLRNDFGVKYERKVNEEFEYWDSKAIYYELAKMFELDLQTIDDTLERTKFNFIGAAVFNFLQETKSNFPQYINVKAFLDNRKANAIGSIFEDAVMHILTNIALNETFYPLESDPATRKPNLQQSLFSEITHNLTLYIKMIKELKIKKENIAADDARSMALYIRKNDSSFLKFYKVYRDSFIDKPYLNFNWRNMSSGEKALFTIYSRFYSLTNENLRRKEAMLKRNLIVLMDEPDAYLHPAWQKQLVDSLHSFLRSIFAKTSEGQQRSLQLIFTTNNPLSITDLPHNNVILLKRENDYLQLTGFSDNKRTFAANIFDLYTDSFFLSNGYTGNFAVKKINAVFEDLNSADIISDERKEEIKKIIHLIGEPLIKNKLIEMYHQKEVLANDYELRLKKLEDHVLKDDRNKKK